jgi:uncharacterized repeat protein (TIGR01451 family)
MVRRRIAAGAAVVLLIIVVLVINGCLKSQKKQSLKDYNHDVSELAQDSVTQVSQPLFVALTGAASKSALEVDNQINQLRIQAQELAGRAKKLSAPGEMSGAQHDLLLTFDLRLEGMEKMTTLVPKALGGQAKQTSTAIAGDMEIFLASDVIYSQRVAPLIQETLANTGITGLSTASSRFLPNIGWLEPNTVYARITGQGASSSANGIAPGTHGSSLVGVSVGANQLQPEETGTLNHISGGGSPTFTVTVENTGTNPESNVKVDVVVTAGGKQFKASHVVNSTQPGTKVNVEVPVTGIPVGVASKVAVNVEGVPGETNVENNKNVYLAIFGE